MKEKPVFITVHGIDGTGKTTTSNVLSQELTQIGLNNINYDIYETEQIDNPFSSLKKRVLTETSPTSQLAFYLGSNVFHSERIEELLQLGYSVVKSRYIDDVLAHHAHLGVKNVVQISQLFPIVQPDLRVILTIDEEVRQERIKQREEIDWKDKEIRNTGSRLDFFENFLLEHSSELRKIGKAIQLDTTYLNPQQIAYEIIDHLLSFHHIKDQ